MTRSTALLIALLFLSLAFNAWSLTQRNSRSHPAYFKSEQIYIDRAIKIWSEKTGVSAIKAMESRYPQAIYAGNLVCVGLILKPGSVGANPAYCFSTKDGRLIERYDDEQ